MRDTKGKPRCDMCLKPLKMDDWLGLAGAGYSFDVHKKISCEARAHRAINVIIDKGEKVADN